MSDLIDCQVSIYSSVIDTLMCEPRRYTIEMTQSQRCTIVDMKMRIAVQLQTHCVMYHVQVVQNKLCGRPPQYAPCKLTFDLLTLKVVSESRVTWATSVPNLVFLLLGLSVLDLGPMYAIDRQTDRRLSASASGGITSYAGGRHNMTPPLQVDL